MGNGPPLRGIGGAAGYSAGRRASDKKGKKHIKRKNCMTKREKKIILSGVTRDQMEDAFGRSDHIALVRRDKRVVRPPGYFYFHVIYWLKGCCSFFSVDCPSDFSGGGISPREECDRRAAAAELTPGAVRKTH